MSVQIDIGWLCAILLLAARVAGATAFVPVFGPQTLPGSVRVLVAFVLASLFLSALPSTPAVFHSLTELTVSAIVEAIIGASFAFGFLVAYAATQVAGRVLDIQVGFSVAAVLNPATRTTSALISTLLGVCAIAVFLGMDGHHVLLRALALSVQTMPPGATGIEQLPFAAFFAHSAVMFTYGLALAAPIMFALLLADLALALFARSMPQLNVFVLSFAVKIVLGMLGLALSIRLSLPVVQSLFEKSFQFWGHLAVAR
jgi:flagellar biosynthetic protein FliR